MAGEDKPFDLRAEIERAYNEIQHRKGKPRREPREPLRNKLPRLQDRERFIALCQRECADEDLWRRNAVRNAAAAAAHGHTAKTTPPRSMVRVWVEEYRRKTPDPANCAAAHFSFPLVYVSHVAALAVAQGEGELDLREETVRRLLGGGTFDDSVADAAVPARQSQVASKKRGPGPLKRALGQIRESHQVRTLDDLLEVFEESYGGPVPFHDFSYRHHRCSG